jgi:endonuclease YncB( thermonuclease family)
MIKKILYAIGSAILAIFGVSQLAISESTQLEVLKVTKVHDGDTFKVNLNCDLDLFCREIPIRPTGYDAFELNDAENKADAIAAREQLRDLLVNAQRIELKKVKRGKYFRLVADVYIDNVKLSDIMLDTGLVKPYDK